MPASLILVPQATGLRIEPLAGLLVQADADTVTAFEHLPRWDVAAAHLQGELVGLLRAFRAVANLPNAVTDDEVLARARALATPTPAAAAAVPVRAGWGVAA